MKIEILLALAVLIMASALTALGVWGIWRRNRFAMVSLLSIPACLVGAVFMIEIMDPFITDPRFAGYLRTAVFFLGIQALITSLSVPVCILRRHINHFCAVSSW